MNGVITWLPFWSAVFLASKRDVSFSRWVTLTVISTFDAWHVLCLMVLKKFKHIASRVGFEKKITLPPYDTIQDILEFLAIWAEKSADDIPIFWWYGNYSYWPIDWLYHTVFPYCTRRQSIYVSAIILLVTRYHNISGKAFILTERYKRFCHNALLEFLL